MHMLRESRGVLAGRQFRAPFSARTISVVGNAVAPVALAFGVPGLHGGSATCLGLVLFTRSAAQVGCLLLAGMIADRFPRYWVMGRVGRARRVGTGMRGRAVPDLIPQEALSRVSSYDALGSFALGPLGFGNCRHIGVSDRNPGNADRRRNNRGPLLCRRIDFP